MTLSSLLLPMAIAIAGACGATTRYLINLLIARYTSTYFPLATLFINVTGAFLIGLFFSLASHHLLTPTLQFSLSTGFLGGYTTFSTLNWETFQLARNQKMKTSILYLLLTFSLGLSSALLGLYLGGRV